MDQISRIHAFGMELVDPTKILKESEFKVFSGNIANGGKVMG